MGEVASIPSRLHGTIGWEHIYGDEAGTATHAFTSSSDFSIVGAASAPDNALLGLGMDFDVTNSIRLGAAYTGRFASEESNDTYQLKFTWSY